MALRRLPGSTVKTDQDDARLRDALRDVDHWRDRANAAEQDLADFTAATLSTAVDLDMARHEIDRLKHALKTLEATALPRLSDKPLIDGGPVQALIGEALDMEIGGEK